MTLISGTESPLQHADRFYIAGEWVVPSSDATIEVTDSATEKVFLRIAEAREPDMARAAAAARDVFDDGPWSRLSHAQRADYLRAIAAGLRERAEVLGQVWPRESGVLHKIAGRSASGAASVFDYYAGLADTFSFEESATPSEGASSVSS